MMLYIAGTSQGRWDGDVKIKVSSLLFVLIFLSFYSFYFFSTTTTIIIITTITITITGLVTRVQQIP